MTIFLSTIRLLRLLSFLLTLSCSSLAQAKTHKIMHFNSAFGNFTMETPVAWKEVSIQSTGAYDGRIAVNAKDTLDFSYGFWVSQLNYGLLTSTYGDNLAITAAKYPSKIDGYIAYTQAPQQVNDWTARIYIDSVFCIGRTVMRFDFYGHHLSPEQERQFYAAAETIKFEDKVNR